MKFFDTIPPDAEIRILTPKPGGSQEGVEFKFQHNGKTMKIRMHDPDPSAPPGCNARSGWIFRIQQGKEYYDDNGNLHPAGVHNPASPNYNPAAANDTHMPLKTPSLSTDFIQWVQNSGTYGL